MVYVNGHLPAEALSVIPGTDRRIWSPLLPQFVAFRAAFAARFGKALVVTDAYRTYERQVELRQWYEQGFGAYAVPPGTSNHGLGLAVDLGSMVNKLGTPEHNWAVANGPRFGFTWLTRAGNGSVEPWHFDGTYVSPSHYITIPPPKQEDDMPLTQADFDAIRQQAANGTIQALQGAQGQAIIADLVKKVVAGIWLETKVQPSNTSILQFLAAGAVGGGADGATPAEVEAVIRKVLGSLG